VSVKKGKDGLVTKKNQEKTGQQRIRLKSKKDWRREEKKENRRCSVLKGNGQIVTKSLVKGAEKPGQV